MFSQAILTKIKAAAKDYASKTHQQKHSHLTLMERVCLLTGHKYNPEKISEQKQLDKVILIVSSSLESERKKALLRSTRYNNNRHLELNKLFDLLKEKRGKLIANRV